MHQVNFPSDAAPGLSNSSLNVDHVTLIGTAPAAVTLANVSALSETNGTARRVFRSSFGDPYLLGDTLFVSVRYIQRTTDSTVLFLILRTPL